MREAVIVDCLRTAVGKSGRGALRNARPDDLAAAVIGALVERYPAVKDDVDDVILGCAIPEGEAGSNAGDVLDGEAPVIAALAELRKMLPAATAASEPKAAAAKN